MADVQDLAKLRKKTDKEIAKDLLEDFKKKQSNEGDVKVEEVKVDPLPNTFAFEPAQQQRQPLNPNMSMQDMPPETMLAGHEYGMSPQGSPSNFMENNMRLQPPTMQPPPIGQPKQPEVTPELAINAQQQQPQVLMPPYNPSGYDLQQLAIAQGAEAGAAKAAEQAAVFKTAHDKAMQMDREREAFQAEQAKKFQARGEELDRALVDAGKMAVDPDRYWNSRSTGGQVMMGIGLLLGSFGGVGTGGKNSAVELLKHNIDKDLELQQAAIKNRRENLSDRRGLLGEMHTRFKSDVEAMAAAKAAYLQNMQLKINEVAARYTAPEVKANAAKAIGELEVAKQEALGKFWKEWQARQPVGPNASMQSMTEEQRKRFVPGYGLAMTDKGAETANNDIIPARKEITSLIGRMMALGKKSGSSINPVDRAEAEVLQTILTGALADPITKGNFAGPEIAVLEKLGANPTNFFSLDMSTMKKLETLLHRIQHSSDLKLKQLGLMSTEDRLGITGVK